MNTPLHELKTRARIAWNAVRRAGGGVDEGKLRLFLHQAARDVGFEHWDHARTVLGGYAQQEGDFGRFWHAPRADSLLNQWFATYPQAHAAHVAQGASGYLLPYRRQCLLVQAEFVVELGIDPQDAAWAEMGWDVVSGYGGAAWGHLVAARLGATRALRP